MSFQFNLSIFDLDFGWNHSCEDEAPMNYPSLDSRLHLNEMDD
jgi:hypothetical protein